jgi:hypothetical protein
VEEGHGGTPEGLGSGPLTIYIFYFSRQGNEDKLFKH